MAGSSLSSGDPSDETNLSHNASSRTKCFIDEGVLPEGSFCMGSSAVLSTSLAALRRFELFSQVHHA